MPSDSAGDDVRVALVSGATGGIGAATADRLRRDGLAVVGADLTEGDGVIRCDVTDAKSCAAAVEATLQRHGRLDVLANVAGIASGGRIEDVSEETWRRVLEVNLTGTFLLSQAALTPLLATTGTIVNMASLAGVQATPYNAAYCAAKAGVIQLTRSMALELADRGVRVNAVCPGAVDTALLAGYQLPEDADMNLIMRSVSPTGAIIRPEEVAGAVSYLVSADAANVNGTTLVIDGGASA